MATPADSVSTKTEAELLRLVQQPEAHAPDLVAAAQQELQRRRASPETPTAADYNSYEAETPSRLTPILLGVALLVLVGLGYFWYQRPPATAAAPAPRAISPDSLKLETAVAAPLPKFDIESPILRQLALLPPAERATTGTPMRYYQQLTRRFWLAQYSTDYLLQQARTGQPNLAVFAQQLATTQGHWRVLREGLGQVDQLPPTMTDHLTRMKEVEDYQQAALSVLQADCAHQRPLHLDAATLAVQQQVKKILAPLQRNPGPLTVHLH